jgi:hypothetical protein
MCSFCEVDYENRSFNLDFKNTVLFYMKQSTYTHHTHPNVIL